MTPHEVGLAYDKITHLWERKEFDQQRGIPSLTKAMSFNSSAKSALDVGCGCNMRLMSYLLENGFEVQGVDVSETMIAKAQVALPDVVFHNCDIIEWQTSECFDLIFAWDSLWHLDVESQKQVLSKFTNMLNRNGLLMFSFGGTLHEDEHSNEAMGVEMFYGSLGTNGYLSTLIALGLQIKHLEYTQYPDQFSYLIAQKI